MGIAVGLVLAAVVLGRSLADIRKTERFVTVKGFAEREVQADLAVWPIQLEAAGNAVAEVSQLLESTRAKVLAFLKDKGSTRRSPARSSGIGSAGEGFGDSGTCCDTSGRPYRGPLKDVNKVNRSVE
jgi:hypothetical protein